MISFNEWTQPRLDENVDASQFPITLKAIENTNVNSDPQKNQLYQAKQKDRFLGALNKLNTALENKQIYNPDYIDVKSNFNNALELAQKNIRGRYFHAGKYQSLPPEVQQIGWDTINPQLHTIKGLLKKFEKHVANAPHPYVHEMAALIKEWQPIAEQMDSIKAMVVKGRKPNPNAEPKKVFTPPPAAHNDLKTISGLLTQITIEVHTKLVQSFKDQYKQTLDAYMAAQEKDPKINPYEYYKQSAHNLVTIRNLTDPEVPYQVRSRIKVKPDADKIMESMANEQADFIQQSFVSKNTEKLAKIVAAKGNLKSAKVVSANAHYGTIQGQMNFVFADNSQFTVMNSAVWSYSIYNKPFIRFPTTFHDVVMPDGTSMKQPSEERMHTLFTNVSSVMKTEGMTSFKQWREKQN